MTSHSVLDGAEPFLLEGSSTGILISHGYTGSTQSVRYVAEQLHRIGGYTVLGPRLAGHGVSPQEMDRTRAQDWVDSIDEALGTLRQRCARIFMMGLSMGGCLTLLSAARHPDIAAIVPINACVYFGAPSLAAKAYDRSAPRFFDSIGADIKAEGVTELAYDEIPTSTLAEIYGLMSVARDLLPEIKCPALVLQSTEDHVVPPDNGNVIVDGIGSDDKTLTWLENSYHVATLDNDKDRIVELAHRFFERLPQ
ncbi:MULTISPECIES: alpha/beta hydrolase [Burkholderia]|uniref:alpha/beta hydrolase n=1 Tax=Burkholderia TaxID=32008 RepID=UPI000841B793|nr:MULTISPECIES: alpha/beta fold hydrolase [unclassified Burkholderia]AOK30940.1 hypothetical protein AQ611_07930 [Burkholderia sp. Bp7605]